MISTVAAWTYAAHMQKQAQSLVDFEKDLSSPIPKLPPRLSEAEVADYRANNEPSVSQAEEMSQVTSGPEPDADPEKPSRIEQLKARVRELMKQRAVRYGLATAGGAAVGAGAGALVAGKGRRAGGAIAGGITGAAASPLALYLAEKYSGQQIA